MMIVPGPTSVNLGSKISNLLEIKVAPVEFKFFPDGESYIRFTEDISGEDVVIVQSTGPPQDTSLIQLLLMIDAAKDLEARSIVAIVPYLAYARQDKRFRPGEAISIRAVIELLETAGIDRFITVNIHNPEVMDEFVVPAESLSAIPQLAKYFKDKDLTGAFSLAPDKGAVEIVKEADKILNGGYGWLEKERNIVTGEVTIEEKEFNVKDKNVIIFDDIISTGGTVSSAAEILKKQGAKKVYAACVHPLLVGDARERILTSGVDEIVGTDCISSSFSVVSVAPLIAEALKRGV